MLNLLRTRYKTLFTNPPLLWETIEKSILASSTSQEALQYMEESGGEPAFVHFDENNQSLLFFDTAAESPKGRRSFCYDADARLNRKDFPPANSACEWAQEHELALLNEADYHQLQNLKPVDLKTSSWLHTPTEIRALGGAIFGDRRYNHVFIYHNGAQSYYAARGFRCKVEVPLIS